VPLHSGNRWQYLVEGWSLNGTFYYLDSSFIKETIKYDSLIYYRFDTDETYRYDRNKKALFSKHSPDVSENIILDFTKPAGYVMREDYSIIEGTIHLFNSDYEYKGLSYQHPYGNSGSSKTYVQGIGLAHMSSFAFYGGNYGSSSSTLIQAIIKDSSGEKLYTHPYLPEINNINSKLDIGNKFVASFKVSHEFSKGKFSFIDSVSMHSFYMRNRDTVYNTPITITSDDSMYKIETQLNDLLLENGYVFCYWFAAKDKSMFPRYGYSQVYMLKTSGIGSELSPSEFNLKQNYPNPFNSSTIINYKIPLDSDSIIKIFDILGNEIVQFFLDSKNNSEGSIVFNASTYNLSSGIYFCQLISDFDITTIKMLYMK
jgi:hypothetical protein